MKALSISRATAFAVAATFALPALADDLEGEIESIDADRQSFVVQGIEFETTQRTDYDDGLNGFADLKEGQRIEVDFTYENGKHTATEVELDE